jgi:hypothetical protein
MNTEFSLKPSLFLICDENILDYHLITYTILREKNLESFL